MRAVFALYRGLLSLRYDITIHGIERLQGPEPALILPNHPALVDPQILFTHFGKYRTISPVITETYYSIPVLKQALDAFGAIPVADLER